MGCAPIMYGFPMMTSQQSYWWRREFSNFSQFHHRRISSPAQVIIIQDNTRMGLERHQYALYHLPCCAIITRSISTRILSIEPPSSSKLAHKERAGVSFVRSNFDWCSYYNDVIMSVMASQITSFTIVYSVVYSGTDQRKHQSCASLAFVRGIHRWLVNSLHQGQ